MGKIYVIGELKWAGWELTMLENKMSKHCEGMHCYQDTDKLPKKSKQILFKS